MSNLASLIDAGIAVFGKTFDDRVLFNMNTHKSFKVPPLLFSLIGRLGQATLGLGSHVANIVGPEIVVD